MKLLAKMLALVATKFQDKLDKQGIPYFEHCYHVMKTCGLTDENDLCIALGHDLIEDTNITFDYLSENFNPRIAQGIYTLSNLSHYKNYDEFINVVSESTTEIIKIKLADIRHNMDASRLKGFGSKDIERMIKYMRAVETLEKVLLNERNNF